MNNNDTVQLHKESFENIYKKMPANTLVFPLEEIDRHDWNRGPYANPYYSFFYKRFSNNILNLLDIQDGQAILILGCGAGSDEKNIRHLFPKCVLWSIDISSEMLIRAVTGGSPSNFSLALAEQLPFPDNCFDRILSREVIEHVINPQGMMNEVYRVLKPEGVAVITTENEESSSPVNFYDGRIYPVISKIFGIPRKQPTFRDQAPSLSEFKGIAAQSHLFLDSVYYDGALYKYLIQLRWVFRNRLAHIAEFFTCLENSKHFSFVFCDQVKYRLLKKEYNKQAVVNKVEYVCPLTHELLKQDRDGHYIGNERNIFYPVRNGYIDFLSSHDQPDNPPVAVHDPKDRSRQHKSAPVMTLKMDKYLLYFNKLTIKIHYMLIQQPGLLFSKKHSKNILFKYVNTLFRNTYGFLYLSSAVIASLLTRGIKRQSTVCKHQST